MKVLLINPPIRERVKADIPPWGLVYVAQSMLDEGHEVVFLDLNAHRWSREEVLDRISKLDFDLVGIGGLITQYSYLKWITLELKKKYPEIPIIAGGFVATPIPKIIFSNTGVDIICYGEADITVKELLKALESGKDLRSVKGLFLKKEKGDFLQTPPRPLIKNLDDIPIPKSVYEKLLPMDIYIQNASGDDMKSLIKNSEFGKNLSEADLENIRHFNLITGRGCTHNCSFCYRMIKGIRKHSVNYVLEYLRYLKENYNITTFTFNDEEFLAKPKWVEEFCDALISSDLNIHFRAIGRADAINKDVLIKLKKTGCYYLGFGIESGSQKMLDVMNKRIDVRKNYEAMQLLREYNLPTAGTFIVGMPGENRKTIEETRIFIKECEVTIAGVFYATPYPNAKLYKIAIERGLISNEEEFLESIADLDASTLTINFTNKPDHVLHKYMHILGSEAEKNKITKIAEDGLLKNYLKYVFKITNFYIKRTVYLVYLVSFDLKLDGYERRLYWFFKNMRKK